MEALYSLEHVGSTCFYEQDEDGFLTKKIDRNIASKEFFKSTLLVRNIPDVAAWRGIKSQKDFESGAWQLWT
jgi:hypothetical protein